MRGARLIMKTPRYLGYLGYTKILNLTLFHKLRFGALARFSASFDALATSGTTPKLQVSLYST